MIDLRPLGIEDYAERHSKPLSDIHSKLWLETFNKTRSPGMMVGALEGAFLKMLVRMTGARRILEIGMFTGYRRLNRTTHLETPPTGGGFSVRPWMITSVFGPRVVTAISSAAISIRRPPKSPATISPRARMPIKSK